MKRSEINAILCRAKIFFNDMNFHLPPWAFWGPEDWIGLEEKTGEIRLSMIGWDTTDFSGGDFSRQGLTLFTMRNGIPASPRYGKPYCEKIMVVREEQETPMHFHWKKTEDIINRGGGNLVMQLYGSTESGGLSEKTLSTEINGIRKMVNAGETLILTPGESICLTPGMYHRFYGEKGMGNVLVGEVSTVNDDSSDNKFLEVRGRFPGIVEDEEVLHYLVSDYKNIYK